jgi:hypothetical protein
MVYLESKGWRAIRERGEPVYFRDPLKCESWGMRVEEAYDMQKKREATGVSK